MASSAFLPSPGRPPSPDSPTQSPPPGYEEALAPHMNGKGSFHV